MALKIIIKVTKMYSSEYYTEFFTKVRYNFSHKQL